MIRLAKLTERNAGILLHPTSLPSVFGIGDFGPAAYRFVDWLAGAGQRYWQVLPLMMPDVVGSPYSSSSAFAGNWLLVSPELLHKDGLLPGPVSGWSGADAPVHYQAVARRKAAMLAVAFERSRRHASRTSVRRFARFQKQQAEWLQAYALFAALKEHFGVTVPWTRWPRPVRQRRPAAIRTWQRRLKYRIALHTFVQWVVAEQWTRLKRHANSRGIYIIGDLPLFVTRDSADTWANPRGFLLDHLGRPRLVAGVPPDYFSHRGQVWGDPLYDWTRYRRQRFAWWLARFRRSFALYDIVRLDHFRGYVAAWGIRAKSPTARHGAWYQVPGRELFRAVRHALPHARFIAEDLGVITDDVVKLRNELGLPGVRVLQFGFDDLGSVHALGNISRRSVLYTGTHDNNTTRGWFGEDAQRHERRNILKYFHATEKTVAWHMVRAAYRNRANTVIVPLQDVLNLGSAARMNTPGTRTGNWRWRFSEKLLKKRLARSVSALVRTTRR
ncbi:MAG: 4-alpha-glucanotransferase [Candidatus Kerfeldbacteria bacterium]|nr:4-alpha-glucanotransferase [Candidatus Kerfeldbacteria bacterium]